MDLFRVPEERRYWVVRADGGLYYDHFVQYGVIALGHLDGWSGQVDADKPFAPQDKTVTDQLKRILENAETASSHALASQRNQTLSFIRDMKVGDWVVAVGNYSVRVGRITGHPRLAATNDVLRVVYDPKREKYVDMPFRLRRKVQWGPTVARSRLPYGLLVSLKANQTLFNIDKHWYAVCHTFYPAFIRGESLYLSMRINTEDHIGSYSVSSLLGFLSEIEVIAKELDDGVTVKSFDSTFTKYVEEDALTSATQAQFNSPGEIWNSITALASSGDVGSWSVYAVTAYAMLFGNQKLGFDGLVDLQTRQKLWDLVIDRMKRRGLQTVVEKLALSAPADNTKALEDSSNDEKSS